MQSRPEKGLPGSLVGLCESVWAVWVCGGGSNMDRCGGPHRCTLLSAFLSERCDLHQVTTPQSLSFPAVKEAHIPPLFGVSREDMNSWEEGSSSAGPGEGTSRSWLPPRPFAAAVAVITALVPGATVLLRLSLCVLVLRLQNIPSFQFSNLDRPGCLGEEDFFPMDHGGYRSLGRE